MENQGVNILVEKDKGFVKNYFTQLMIDSVGFWNREGSDVIEKNKLGKLGSEETNKMALTMQADDFLLEMLLGDAKTICKGGNNPQHPSYKEGMKYECGRTRSHVWFHINDERVMMIHAISL